MSSDEENQDDGAGLEDIDSDDADIIMGDQDGSHALSQQQDYIAFS